MPADVRRPRREAWRRAWLLALCVWLPEAASAQSAEGSRTRFKGYLAAEPRLFPQDGRFAEQDAFHASLAAELDLRHEWAGRRFGLAVVPFLRLDRRDPERTHFDVREAAFRFVGGSFELLAGVSKVFWGVTESQHLVDVVNQTDLIENPDGEDKLGQPMLHLTLARSWGTLNAFVLPRARPRSFPGREGRLRPGIPVDTDAAVFEAGRWHLDYALRWSKTLGVVDLGLSHFYGTAREPRLAREGSGGERGLGEEPTRARRPPADERLIPHYELIHQTGLDAQLTLGQWLLKLEAIHRTSQGPRFAAATAGFEYTLANVGGSGADVGLIAEYLFDERGDRATTPWQDDLFAGVRLARGDAQSTELLAGVIVDRKSGAKAWNVEASRRLSARGKLSLEARFFGGSEESDPLFELRRDDYFQLAFAFHF